LRFELFEGGDEVGEAFSLLLDDRRRRARDEALVGEFRLRLADLALQPRDFLVESFAFGSEVDFTCSISRVSPTTAIGALASSRDLLDHLHLRELAQRLEIGSEADQ
jgi:hypothetical protein